MLRVKPKQVFWLVIVYELAKGVGEFVWSILELALTGKRRTR